MEPTVLIPALIRSAIAAAPIAVTALWQGAIIACGLAICLRLAPGASAAHRFCIWAAGFVALVSLPLFSLISDSASRMVGGGFSALPESAAGPWIRLDARWSLAIAALWAVGTVVRAGDLAFHSFRLRKLWKGAIPIELDRDLKAVRTLQGNRGTVEVCTTAMLQRPSVIGFLRPRILIPEWLFGRLTAGELEQIVLHETEHLRRWDDWTNLVQKLCLVLFPLNPALAWIERRLCREREMACDDGVIRITKAPRAYAACLASLAERGMERRAEALSLGAWQRRPELVHRVHSILRRRGRLGPGGTLALLSGLGCSLVLGSIELARCPQLVAFVPARDQDRKVSELNATQTVASGVPARLVNAGYVAAGSAGAGGSGFRAVNLKADLPVRGPMVTGDAEPLLRGNGAKAGGEHLSKTPSNRREPDSPRSVLLKAQLDDERPAQQQAQQWIVLAAWEQVLTSNENAGLRADFETGPGADASSDTSAAGEPANSMAGDANFANPQQARQITITRLILRVIPASTFSTQPAYVPLHGGWFLIQL